jgi:hypothetical protein
VPSEPQSTKTEVVRHVDETDLTHGGPPSEQATVSPAVTSVRSLVMVVVAIVGVIGTIAIVVSVAIALASPNSSRQGRRYS